MPCTGGKSGDFVERNKSFQVLLNEVQNCTVLKNAGSSIPRGRMADSQGGVLLCKSISIVLFPTLYAALDIAIGYI